jgi:zinc protease
MLGSTACETSKQQVSSASTPEPVVEEAENKQEISLDYEKYTLDNGLEVILHQDHSDPIVAVSIVYHVGSSREKPGRTGFAHFFEHMLFQSSENVPKGHFFSRINDLGGTFNGGTWTDGTIYYETVPKDALEKVLWMESDRMGFFINTVTRAALENEKLVVKNEKRQRYDNQPYGHTSYVINKALYPGDHPYNWLTIGSLADLQAATVDDVKEFYESYYGTNNATLVIAGDFEKDQAREWVKKYFGEIEDRGQVPAQQPQVPQLSTNVKVYHEDNYAKVPELSLVWPTVELFNEDSYALDILGDLLADGKRAPLYKVLVEQQKIAPSPRAYNSSQELAGTFNIKIRTFDNKDLDQAYSAVMAALDSFAINGFTEQDLERIRNMQETNLYNGLTSVFGKAYQLAYYNEFAGSPDKLLEDVEKYQQVSMEDVNRVFQQYIRNKPHVIGSFVPQGQLDLAVEGSQKAAVEEEDISSAVTQTFDEDAEAKEIQKTPSAIDRSIEPELGAAPTLNVPQIWDAELANGLNVYGIQYEELPVVQISIRLMGGGLLEEQENAGLTSLLTDLMMEGTANKTPEELEDAIGMLGANISMVTDRESITLYANTLARNYDEVMKLVNEILLRPRWDAQEFERLKEAQLNRIQQAEANPEAVASDVFSKLLYGADNTMAQSMRGTTETVNALTIDNLKEYYNQYFSPSVASFHIVGMIDQNTVMESLEPLAQNWQVKQVNIPVATAKAPTTKPVLYFVDVPNAKQSVIRIGRLAEFNEPAEYFAANVANYHLGQGSGGLLFRILREEKGYTYGAYSGFNRFANAPGYFTASSSVQSNVTKEAVETFKSILDSYQQEYTEAELEKTRQALVRQDARAYETPYQKLGVLQSISTYNMPKDYMIRNQSIIQNMSLEQSKALMQRYMNPNQMVYLIVGDAQTQLGRLSDLGLGKAVVLDKKGNTVNGSAAKAGPGGKK